MLARESVAAVWAITLTLMLNAPDAVVAQVTPAQPPPSPPPGAQPTVAQPPTDPPPAEQESAPSVAVAGFNQRLEAIENSTELDEKQKTKAVDAYQQAISLAGVEASSKERTAEFQSKLQELDDRLAAAQAEQAALPGPAEAPPDESLEALDNAVRLKTGAVEQLRQDIAAIDSEIALRDKRLLEIPTEIADATQRLSVVERERQDIADDLDPLVKAAVTASMEQRLLAVQAELDALKAENAWRVAEGGLQRLRREKTRQQLDSMLVELARFQKAAQAKRESEVDRDLRTARQQLEKVSGELQTIAEENETLAERRLATQKNLQQAVSDQERVANLVKQLEQNFERSQKEVEAGAELSQTLGEILREQRTELRALSRRLDKEGQVSARVTEARLKLYVLRNQEAELEDLEAAVNARAAELTLGEEQQAELKELLEFQRTVVKGLRSDTEALFQALAKLAGSELRLRSLAEQYTTFIDEHVLWVRSTDVFGPQHAKDAWTAVRSAFSPSRWRSLLHDLRATLGTKPILPMFLVLVCVPLLLFHSRLRRSLSEYSRQAESGSCRDFKLTLRAALMTLALAVAWPSLLLLLGLWLQNSPFNSLEIRSLSAGLIGAGAVALLLETWRQAARPDGLMVSHFNSPPLAVEVMHRNLRWLSLVLAAMVGLVSAVLATGNPQSEQSLGRLALVAGMLAMAAFVYRVGHPRHGIVPAFFVRRPNDALFKWRRVLFSIAMGTPLALTLLALIGYQFTATQLAQRLLWTIAALFGLWLAQALVLRWVVLSRRRLAIDQARARLQAAAAPAADDAQPELDEIDLENVDLQTRRLVRAIAFVVGLFAIGTLWMDALPALAHFDELKAWDVSVPAEAVETEPAAANGDAKSVASVRMVSYADVAKAIAILVAMALAMRDLPGLLELVLLQRLPLDNALRLAISTLTRYLIFLAGAIWALGTIEIGWSKVQWLVAGVSVGLGFGLQEIFANFVSGLIILFERPLRAGDIVTIDGVTGVVKRVRMRSTIIQDFDRKDFVVPNRDFITGRLFNWTLSDEVSRIVLPVGVAYGSDTKKAKEIIEQVARDHPLVTDDPAPMATFEAFGESSLDLMLRCFISLRDMSSRLRIIDELNSGIDQRFREAGVEIPFPQRDLHFRNSLPVARAPRLPEPNDSPE